MWFQKTYPHPLPEHSGTEFEVDQWVVSDFVKEVLIPVVGFKPYPMVELCFMTSVICYVRPQIVFEWGTHKGKAARVFYEIANAFEIDCEIHSIDLPDDEDHAEHPGKSRGKLVRGKEIVTLHQGDGLNTSLALYDKQGPFERILFYLDGDHAYSSVMRELEGIYEAVPEANILLHDTFFQTKESKYNIGPYRATKEFIEKHQAEYELYEMHLGLPGMSWLRRLKS